ncbi:MAG: tyrosine-type recombinase/integrase [Holosporaceae bacterium]|jgi:integrase/recombinase XerC|nr:tyrosine-type recombinase/integrase [Holosporaceae bacterium]
MESWLNELTVQLCFSPNTISAYGRDLLDFKNFLAMHNGEEPSLGILRNLKISDFRSWFSHRVSRGLTARSNVRALSAMKSFFNHLARRDLIDLKTINSVRRPKLSVLLPKPISEDVIMRFLDLKYFFDQDPNWVTRRDRALYTLLYCTGLRINEALNIKTNDLDREIRILGKGKKDRIAVLLPLALDRIHDYISACPHDLYGGFLFVGIRGKRLHASYVDNRLQKLRLLHNLPNHASAHAFRHSFATHLIQHGADLRSVQELLGHESVSSTQIYVDVDDYSLLKVYQKTHPLAKRSR